MSDQGHAQQPLHELLTEARQYLVDFGIDEDPETNNNLDALILKIDAALAGEATSSDLSEEALLTIAARCGLSSARPPDETREEVEAQIAYFREHADEFAAAHRGIVDSGRPPREQLRRLVDIVWNECSESTAVPSTNWADRMIDKVFNPGAKEPEASGGLCAIAPHAVRVGEPTRIGAVVGDQEAAEPSSIQDSGRPPSPLLPPGAHIVGPNTVSGLPELGGSGEWCPPLVEPRFTTEAAKVTVWFRGWHEAVAFAERLQEVTKP